MSITTSATTLNAPKTQSVEFTGANPFQPITREQFLADLKESHAQALRGEGREARIVLAEMRQKYGL